MDLTDPDVGTPESCNFCFLTLVKRFITISKDAYEACEDADAIAILTEWDEFKTYDWQKIYDNMLKPAFVFDGRNILDKEKLTKIGFIYQAIGS